MFTVLSSSLYKRSSSDIIRGLSTEGTDVPTSCGHRAMSEGRDHLAPPQCHRAQTGVSPPCQCTKTSTAPSPAPCTHHDVRVTLGNHNHLRSIICRFALSSFAMIQHIMLPRPLTKEQVYSYHGCSPTIKGNTLLIFSTTAMNPENTLMETSEAVTARTPLG